MNTKLETLKNINGIFCGVLKLERTRSGNPETIEQVEKCADKTNTNLWAVYERNMWGRGAK